MPRAEKDTYTQRKTQRDEQKEEPQTDRRKSSRRLAVRNARRLSDPHTDSPPSHIPPRPQPPPRARTATHTPDGPLPSFSPLCTRPPLAAPLLCRAPKRLRDPRIDCDRTRGNRAAPPSAPGFPAPAPGPPCFRRHACQGSSPSAHLSQPPAAPSASLGGSQPTSAASVATESVPRGGSTSRRGAASERQVRGSAPWDAVTRSARDRLPRRGARGRGEGAGGERRSGPTAWAPETRRRLVRNAAETSGQAAGGWAASRSPELASMAFRTTLQMQTEPVCGKLAGSRKPSARRDARGHRETSPSHSLPSRPPVFLPAPPRRAQRKSLQTRFVPVEAKPSASNLACLITSLRRAPSGSTSSCR